MAIKTKSASNSSKSTYKKSKSNNHAGRLLIIAICAVFVLLGVFLIVNSFAGTIAGSSYYKAPVTQRIYDSRATDPEQVAKYIGGGTVTTNKVVDNILPFGAGNTPPRNVKAIVVNATIADPNGNTELKVWQAGTPAPTRAQVTASSGDANNIANEIIVPFDSNGSKYLQITNSQGSSQIVLDYVGYYSTTGNPSPLGSTNSGVIGKQLNYQTVPGGQQRVFDTRTAQYSQGRAVGPIPQDGTISIKAVPIPDPSIKAAIVVVTAVAPTTNGYLEVWEANTLRTNPKSSLSFPAGRNTSNELIVPVDSNGNISIFNKNGSTNVVVDLMGYYKSNTTAVTGRNFIFPTSVNILNNQISAPGSQNTIAVAGKNGVPAESKLAAAIINVRIYNSDVAGYNVLFPSDPRPFPVSSMNFAATPAVTSEQMIVPTGTDGSIRLFNYVGNNRYDVDLVGYITK